MGIAWAWANSRPPSRSADNSHADLYERIVELGSRLHDQELSSADSIGTRSGTLLDSPV